LRRARILIIDDEADICILLAEAIASDEWTVEWRTDPLKGLDLVRSEQYELILLDIKMPEISGLELLPEIKKVSSETAVLIMSAYGNIQMAVQAMKLGAEDYIEKPFRVLEEVRLLVERLVDSARVRIENRILRRQLEERFALDGLVSASPLMQNVFSLIKRVAPIPTTVLIQGETGTGKELMARTLHRYSKQSHGPFVSVNCGGLPEGLLESLLFGHEKGAFTGANRRTKGYFEEAEGGTLFLDEIGDTSLALQVKLLRVLQEHTYQRVGSSKDIRADIRLIAATNKDLEAEVAKGAFRSDLFFRINVIMLTLPPLRDRREDIPLLARHFVDKYSEVFKCNACDITPDAMNSLCSYDWPGNVREMENVIERSLALSDGSPLTGSELFGDTIPQNSDWIEGILKMPLREARQEFEKRYLVDKLQRYNGSVTEASLSAGLPRQNYHRKMKQLGIPSARQLHSKVSLD